MTKTRTITVTFQYEPTVEGIAENIDRKIALDLSDLLGDWVECDLLWPTDRSQRLRSWRIRVAREGASPEQSTMFGHTSLPQCIFSYECTEEHMAREASERAWERAVDRSDTD